MFLFLVQVMWKQHLLRIQILLRIYLTNIMLLAICHVDEHPLPSKLRDSHSCQVLRDDPRRVASFCSSSNVSCQNRIDAIDDFIAIGRMELGYPYN